jgi:pyruvate/2-oxoglutarate dehydrogenase complex dihydrolipoamide dehydrogenase (E3) component
MNKSIEIVPHDEYNTTLLNNAHPPDWKNPEPAPCYNLVVIGGGTAGLVTAAGAAGLGAKVALVEKHLLGGDCLNVGCVPSKCLIRSSRVGADIRDASQFGFQLTDALEVNFPAVMRRMRRIRALISHHDSAERFQKMGVDVFLGEGRFSGTSAVEVDGKMLQFKKAAIAAGARATYPPVEGLAEAGFLTNETVFSLTERPARLAVIGAGPLGCELAQAFHRLGCSLTLVEIAPQILIREDRDAADIIANAFQREGIDIRLKTIIKRVSVSGTGKTLHLETDGKADSIEVDEILIGAGRAPNVEGLNLEAAGVKYDAKTGVAVDDMLRTTNPDIYAAGDVCLSYKFTHMADASARIVIQNALFWGRKRLSALTVPWCTFTDPEIAHVGLYEKDAVERNIAVETFLVRFNEVDRALADGEEEGLMKIHVKKGTDKILGATVVARHAGEMISEITLAMVGNLGLKAIANVIHPYPTQAEAFKHAADAYDRARLTPFVKKIFAQIFAWRR